MAQYLPPLQYLPIFNSDEFNYANEPINVSTGNSRYIKKTGADTAVGPLTLSNKLILPNGTVGLPSLTFSNSSTAGLYLIGTNSIGFATNGVLRLTLDTSKLTSGLPIVIPSGTSSNCAIQLSGSANTGFNLATGQVFLVTSGTSVGSWTTSFFTTSIPIKAPNGTATSCAYQFSSEAGMGLFYETTNTMGFAVGGTQNLRLTNLGLTFTNSGIIGASPTPLNYFEEYSYSTTFGFVGFNQTISYTLKITRIGNRVFLYVPSWSAGVTNNTGGNALCITATAMASRFYPPNGVSMIGFGYLSGTANLVWIFVNSVGNILIYKGVGVGNATWANTEVCRIEGFSMDWTIN